MLRFLFFICSFLILNLNAQNSKIDSLYKLSLSPELEVKTKAYSDLSRAFRINQPQKAIQYAKQGIEIAYQQNFESLKSELHFQLGSSYAAIPEYDKAIEQFRKAYELTVDKKDSEKKFGEICYQLGKSLFLSTDFVSSKIYAEKAIHTFENVENYDRLSDSYNLLALIYNSINETSKGLKFLAKAAEIAEKVDNKSSLANININLGNSYADEDNLEKALEHYKKALKYGQAVDYDKAVAASLNNIGDIYISKKQYEKAKVNFIRAIEADKSPMKRESAPAYNNIGEVYVKFNEPYRAQEYFEKSLEISTLNQDDNNKTYTLFNLGKLFYNSKRYKKALEYLGKSSDLGKKIHDLPVQRDANLYISKVYKAKGQFKKALEYQSTFYNFKDSIVNNREQNKINELQVRYDVRQKEKQIENLVKNKTISDLEKVNEESEKTIFKMILFGTVAVLILIVIGAYLLYNRYNESRRINNKLIEKNNIIETQRNKIIDSITYAKNIQQTILKPEDEIKHIIPNFFVYYQPRDIVSGDLYWVKRIDQKIVIAAIDCTGHGVPGAFLTLITNMLLKRIIEEKHETNPSEILHLLDQGIINTLKQDSIGSNSYDGLDMSLVVIDESEGTLSFAGAMNPIYVVQSHQLQVLSPSIHSIGGKSMRRGKADVKNFKTTTIPYMNDTSIYMITDGYVDQFGGMKKSKFNTKRFKELVLEIYQEDMKAQKEIIHNTMSKWKGRQRQLDDMLVLGFRLNASENKR